MIRYKIRTSQNEYLFEDMTSAMNKLNELLSQGYGCQLFYKGLDGYWKYYHIREANDE